MLEQIKHVVNISGTFWRKATTALTKVVDPRHTFLKYYTFSKIFLKKQYNIYYFNSK